MHRHRFQKYSLGIESWIFSLDHVEALIPIYNAQNLLKECVESAQADILLYIRYPMTAWPYQKYHVH